MVLFEVWDMRRPDGPDKMIHAHNGLILSIDYYMDGRYLLSGGRDKLIHVWDLKSDARKSEYTFHSVASVARVIWRPDHVTQFASCSLLTDFRINIWDLSRCYLPFMAFEENQDAVTGILWKDSSTIWACSKDKSFSQYSIENAYKPSDLMVHSAISWSADGKIAVVLERLPSTTMKKERER
jgi:WD40 repeat protein